MIRLRPALWPTLISLPIFVVSLGLGIWQMERREWKRDILDRIAVNQAAAPLTLDELLQGDPLRHEYGRVKIAGSFLHDKEFYLAARSLKNTVGLQVVTPIKTDDGRIVLFDRGFIPQEKKDPARRAEGQLAGTVELTGIVRRNQEQRQFAPDNAPDRNVWFHVDVPLMRSMAGAQPDPKLDAFFLEADAAANPGGVPVGGQTRLDIPNDHLQYAITWFLIAAALAGVYLAYHWENGRLTDRRPHEGQGHDRQRSLCRAGAPLRPAERRQSRLRDPELGSLDDDARRRQRRPRRSARHAGRHRARHDLGARHARSAGAGGRGRARPRSVARRQPARDAPLLGA